VDQYLANTTNTDQLHRYYLAAIGGSVCATYEVSVETFTSSCSEAKASALRPAEHDTESHGSFGARECPQYSKDCVLSMRHFMRGSCKAFERSPPFIIKFPYTAGKNMDNLVIEVEDLNLEDSPQSLQVDLHAVGGMLHDELQDLRPLRSTSTARGRIFSFGLSSIEMSEQICGGYCEHAGEFEFTVVVACRVNPVKFRVIALVTGLQLTPGIPMHGEICPQDWIYHRAAISLPEGATGLRFLVHVHKGDIYFLQSRWKRLPGFAACNANEMAMTGESHGQVDICNLDTAMLGGTFRDSHGHEESWTSAYIGLFGGTSCAYYTLKTIYLTANDSCSQTQTGACASAVSH